MVILELLCVDRRDAINLTVSFRPFRISLPFLGFWNVQKVADQGIALRTRWIRQLRASDPGAHNENEGGSNQ